MAEKIIKLLVLVLSAALCGLKTVSGIDTWKGEAFHAFQVWKRRMLYEASIFWMLVYVSIWLLSKGSMQAVRFGDMAVTYLILALVDWKQRTVPNIILVCFFAGQMLLGSTETAFRELLLCFLCGTVFAFFLLCLAWMSKGKIGMGDAKLLGVTAMTAGWRYTLQTICWSLIPAALYSVLLLLLRKADMKTELPFVPFLYIGILLQTIALLF